MSNLFGKLADRASIMKSAFSEMELAVIKATKHNTKTPKEKHVRRLVVFTHDEPHRIPELIVMLAKRLEFPDWLVVMKTLCTFHRLMRDGNLQVINELRYKSNLFNLRKFADTSSPEAHHQSIFVRKYSQYMEEKVLVYKILSVEFEKDASITKTYTIEEAFERIPRLQSQMNALLNCRASKDHLNNSIIVNSFGMLLKDSFKLYKALNDGIINLLEHYFSMPKANAVKALDIYKLFAKETDGIIQFYDISRKISKTDLPELQHAPTTLVEALENYIKELDEGRAPISNPGEEKKHMEKFMRDKSHMDKFEFFETDQPNDDSDSDDDSKNKYPSKSNSSGSSRNVRDQQPSTSQPSTSQPSFREQHQNNQPKPQQQQPKPQATGPPMFDPFGDDEPVNVQPNKPVAFDPFGGEDFFSSNTTSQNNFNNNNQNNFNNNNQNSFDPFSNSTVAPNTANNQVPYDDKRKNIEMMFGPTPMQPTNTSPTNSPFVQPNNQQNGFGNNNNDVFGNNNNNGFGNNQGFNNNQQNGFGNNNNNGFGNNQGFNNNQQNGFGNNNGFNNNNNVFGNNNSPFGNQQQQQQPTFAPVTNSNSNPFLSDNSNPFG